MDTIDNIISLFTMSYVHLQIHIYSYYFKYINLNYYQRTNLIICSLIINIIILSIHGYNW